MVVLMIKCIRRLQRVVRSNSIKYDTNDSDCTFWAYYNMDIMGDGVEFSQAEMSRSLLDMYQSSPGYKTDWIKDITFYVGGEESWLRLYHNFKNEELAEYVSLLKEIRSGTEGKSIGLEGVIDLVVPSLFEIKEKEINRSLRGYDSFRYYTARSCIWWDLDNHVMFSFDKTMINKVPHLIKNTF